MVDWNAFQESVGEWAEENFGNQSKINPFIGTAEERAELAEHLLTNEFEPGSEEEIDAIGDILVFFADYCYRHNISYEKAAEKRNDIQLYTDCETLEDFCVETVISRGNQAYSLLKQDQGIREEREGVGEKADIETLAHTLRAIETFAQNRGYTLHEAIDEAWSEVQVREWDSNYN